MEGVLGHCTGPGSPNISPQTTVGRERTLKRGLGTEQYLRRESKKSGKFSRAPNPRRSKLKKAATHRK